MKKLYFVLVSVLVISMLFFSQNVFATASNIDRISNFSELKEAVEKYNNGDISSLPIVIGSIVVDEDFTLPSCNIEIESLEIKDGCALYAPESKRINNIKRLVVNGSLILNGGGLSCNEASVLEGISNIKGVGEISLYSDNTTFTYVFADNVTINEGINIQPEKANVIFTGKLILNGKITVGDGNPKLNCGKVFLNGGVDALSKGTFEVFSPNHLINENMVDDWKSYVICADYDLLYSIRDSGSFTYNNIPYKGQIIGVRGNIEHLSNPINPTWSVKKTWDNTQGKDLFNYANVKCTTGALTQNKYEFRLYNLANDYDYPYSWQIDYGVHYCPEILGSDPFQYLEDKKDYYGNYVLVDGDYYFTVQAIGDNINYASSEVVSSKDVPGGVFHYQRTTERVSAPENVSFLEDGILKVTIPVDVNIYSICADFSVFDEPVSGTKINTGWSYRMVLSSDDIKNLTMISNVDQVDKVIVLLNYSEWIPKDFVHDGYLEAEVMLFSSDIMVKQNSTKTISTNRYRKNKKVNSESEVKSILGNISSTDKAEIVNEIVSCISKDALIRALLNDSNGIAEQLEQLEKQAGVSTSVSLEDSMTSEINSIASGVKVVGAGLNAMDGVVNVSLNIGKPKAAHVIPERLNSTLAVRFSMEASGIDLNDITTGELAVPIKITIPIPGRINPEFIRILHYDSDGTYEEIEPRTYYENEKWYATFVVNHFSDFILTQVMDFTNGSNELVDSISDNYSDEWIDGNFTVAYDNSSSSSSTITVESSMNISANKSNVPTGASLSCSEMKTNSTGYKYALSVVERLIDTNRAYVYDIKLNKNGSKVQPNGTISITCNLPEGLDSSKIVVYRINDDNTYTKLKSSVKNGKVTFETDHFSYYIIAEEGQRNIAKSAKTGVSFLGL